MNNYTVENLEIGFGIAFDWFGGKVKFPSEKLEEMKADFNIRKIYFNFDGKSIVRVK